MFESDASLVAEYNASLTAAYDYANGQGDGWVPTGVENEYILSEIFTTRKVYCALLAYPMASNLVVGNDAAQGPVPGRPVCGHDGTPPRRRVSCASRMAA